MDRASLAFARIFFFVMLFISTACNKVDHSLMKDDISSARPAVATQAPVAEAERVRELESRVAYLENELQNANHGTLAASDVPGGANWD